MSVVAALVHEGRVWMASDRQQTVHDGTVCWPSPPKVQRHDVRVKSSGAGTREVLLAPVGSAAFAQLARFRLDWPALPRRGGSYDSDIEVWAFDVATALTELAAKHKGEGADNDAGPVAPFDGGMLAFDGRLWGLGPYQALPMARGYEAIGSGGTVACGALGALVELYRDITGDPRWWQPAEVVARAVRVAIDQDTACGGDVDVHVLEPL